MNYAIRKGLSMAKTICVIAAAIYFLGSVGAYENDAITTSNFLLRTGVSFLMIFLLY